MMDEAAQAFWRYAEMEKKMRSVVDRCLEIIESAEMTVSEAMNVHYHLREAVLYSVRMKPAKSHSR